MTSLLCSLSHCISQVTLFCLFIHLSESASCFVGAQSSCLEQSLWKRVWWWSSLFKQNNHVVVNIQADIAVGLILDGKAASENDETMPGLPKFVVEFGLDVFCDIRVVRRPKSLQALDHGNHCCLCHLCIHVVPLNPDLPVGGASINFEGVAVVTSDDDGLGAIGSADAVRLHLRCYYFDHFFFRFKQIKLIT